MVANLQDGPPDTWPCHSHTCTLPPLLNGAGFRNQWILWKHPEGDFQSDKALCISSLSLSHSFGRNTTCITEACLKQPWGHMHGRSYTNSHVNEPPWKWLLWAQSSLHRKLQLTDILTTPPRETLSQTHPAKQPKVLNDRNSQMINVCPVKPLIWG